MDVFIVDAVRTPRAKSGLEGAFATLRPIDLLHPLYNSLFLRNPSLNREYIDEVLLGISTPIGEQGSNLAKISALYSGLPETVSGSVISSFCCSGLDAVNTASAKIQAGFADFILAGGVESLTRVPLFADKGPWFSDPEVAKKTHFQLMNHAADDLAERRGYTRLQLDSVAFESHHKASEALEVHSFKKSIVPVQHGTGTLNQDNNVRPHLTLEKLAQLPPLARCHTVATAPALTDAASLLVLANGEALKRFNLIPRARITGCTSVGSDPKLMLGGHLVASKKLLKHLKWTVDTVDLWEVNEAFAASILYFQEELAVPSDRINVNGGALALGHPLGATGGILLATLLDEMEHRKLQRGIATICGGAGLGIATAIERV